MQVWGRWGRSASVVESQRATQVVTVLCPKGGTGKTTVSTNLAVALARQEPGRVALVDLDLAFGDVASALLLHPRYGVAAVAARARAAAERAEWGETGGAHVADLLARHQSGLLVLGAPESVLPGQEPGPDEVASAIGLLAGAHRVVVVDTGAGMDAATLAAVEVSTDLVLVGSMDVPTLLGLRKSVRLLDQLGHTDARRHLVLNRADSDVGLDLEDVRSSVGLPVSVSIPSDAAVTRSVNEGRPVVDDATSPAGAALRHLAQLVLQQ